MCTSVLYLARISIKTDMFKKEFELSTIFCERKPWPNYICSVSEE